MKESNRTFYSGVTAGTALIASAFVRPMETWQQIVAAAFQALAGFGLVWLGAVARDDNISDEGGIAPKAMPVTPTSTVTQPPGAPTTTTTTETTTQ